MFSEEVGHLSTEIALVRNASVQSEVNLTVSVIVIHLSATPGIIYYTLKKHLKKIILCSLSFS